MSYSPPATTLSGTPTVSLVLADIKAFVQAILGAGVPCIRGIVNRVPAPIPQNGFVVMTPIYQERLEYNLDIYSTAPTPWPANESVQTAMRIDVQLDVYGTGGWAGTWAGWIVSLWRDEFACAIMQNSQPLYADEARMVPLIDSEAQYEERWSITLTAQYNPVITPPQEFADGLSLGLVNLPSFASSGFIIEAVEDSDGNVITDSSGATVWARGYIKMALDSGGNPVLDSGGNIVWTRTQ